MLLEYKDTRRLLHRAVKEKGADHVPGPGARCIYFEQGEPRCIVGHVFTYRGLREEALVAVNELDVVHVNQEVDEIKLDHESRIALAIAQRLQDAGVPWGTAAEAAVTAVDTMGDMAEPNVWVTKYLEQHG